MFDLGELTTLEQRVNLRMQDIRRVGPDLRIVARIEASNTLERGQGISPSPLAGECRSEG
jgi:hypothetical protein